MEGETHDSHNLITSEIARCPSSTPMPRAMVFWEIAMGLRYSSRRISPGGLHKIEGQVHGLPLFSGLVRPGEPVKDFEPVTLFGRPSIANLSPWGWPSGGIGVAVTLPTRSDGASWRSTKWTANFGTKIDRQLLDAPGSILLSGDAVAPTTTSDLA